MIKQYHTIALSFGYVENNTTSWLIYKSNDKTPETRCEALESLVAYLWDKYSNEMNKSHERSLGYSYGNKCCQRNWLDNKYVNYIKRTENPISCPTCNMTYPVTWDFDPEEWVDYLRSLHNSIADDYGEHEYVENPYGWSPWIFNFDVPQHQTIIIKELAEDILTLILYKMHPELGEFEDYTLSNDDLSNLLNESYVYNNGSYIHYPITSCYSSITTIVNYNNGGQSKMTDGVYTYSKYPVYKQGENTIAGYDEIWFEFKNGMYNVFKVVDYLGNERTYWIGDQDHP